MSKTGFLWLCLYFGGLASSFVIGPFLGLLTYMFTFYTQFSWARDIVRTLGLERVSLYAGIILLVSYFTGRWRSGGLAYERMPQMKWLILIIVNMIILTPIAAYPVEHGRALIAFIKIVALYYLIIKIVQSKSYYKLFIWLQLWGNSLLGWQAYSRGETIGGRLENIGAPGIQTSNHLANHLVMIIPFVGTMFCFGNRWERMASLLSAPFIVNAIILCNSRGSFLALLVMTGIAILLFKKGVRKKIIIGTVLASILFFYLADEKFWARMSTIQMGQEQKTAASRLTLWSGGLRMVADYPLGKGGGGWQAYSWAYLPDEGGGGLDRKELADQLIAGPEQRKLLDRILRPRIKGEIEPLSVHNTYIMMATEWGIQGLVLLLVFLGGTILELHKIRRRYGTCDDKFYHMESIAIEIAIIGFLAAAAFGDRIYAESLYWYCGLATALGNIQQNELLRKSE